MAYSSNSQNFYCHDAFYGNLSLVTQSLHTAKVSLKLLHEYNWLNFIQNLCGSAS